MSIPFSITLPKLNIDNKSRDIHLARLEEALLLLKDEIEINGDVISLK